MKRLLLSLLLISRSLHATSIGSDTSPTRFNTLQLLNNGDIIAGFAALDGGFALQNSLVSAIFNSFFPVSGPIILNYGTLVLQTDLTFYNVAYFDVLGNISGNATGANHRLNLAQSMNVIPLSGSAIIGSCAITFVANAGTAPNAAVQAVDWNYTTSYIAVGDASDTNHPTLQIYYSNGSSLSLVTGVDPNPTFANNVPSVSWHPSQDWVVIPTFTLDRLFLYQLVNNALSLLSTSPSMGGTSILSAPFSPDGNWVAQGATNGNRLTVIDVSGAGAFGTTPIVCNPNINQQVNSVSWDPTNKFLVVGTIPHAAPVALTLMVYGPLTPPNSPTALVLNAQANMSDLVNAVAWNENTSNPSIIAIGTTPGTGTAPTTSTQSLRLFSWTSGSLTEIPSGVNFTTPVLSLSWRPPNSTCLVVGTSSVVNVYSFVNNTLTLQSTTPVVNQTALQCSRDGNYLAVGTSTPALELYSFGSQPVSLSNVFFNDINIFLNTDVTFQDISITFTGSSSINGQGNKMTLSPTFTLIVGAGGSLLLQDVTVNGVDSSKIKCLSSLSTVSLQDTTFVLDGNFTFTEGRLDVLKNFKISGPNNTFIYTANDGITIRGGFFGSGSSAPFYAGSLTVDTNVTFSYAPSNNSSTLITMESALSKIILNSGTLVAQSLQLINGTLLVGGSSSIQGLTNVTFGNGVAANNLSIEIMPAANLNLLGNIIYSNI